MPRVQWCDRSYTLQVLSADVYKYYLAIEIGIYFSLVIGLDSGYRGRTNSYRLSPIGQRLRGDYLRFVGVYLLHPHLIGVAFSTDPDLPEYALAILPKGTCCVFC